MGVTHVIGVARTGEKGEKGQKASVGGSSGVGSIPRVVSCNEWEGKDGGRGVCATVFARTRASLG